MSRSAPLPAIKRQRVTPFYVISVSDADATDDGAQQTRTHIIHALNDGRRALTIVVNFKCSDVPPIAQFDRFTRAVRHRIRLSGGDFPRIRIVFRTMRRDF